MDSNTNTLPQAVERPALRSGDLFGAFQAAKDAQAEGLRGKYPEACITLAAALQSAREIADKYETRYFSARADAEQSAAMIERLQQLVTTEHETKAEFIARVRAVLSPNIQDLPRRT